MRFDIRTDLAGLKLELQARIDREAGEARGAYITTVPGQEMIYMEKRREAEMILANLETPPTETPHITEEARLHDVTRYEKAVEVITMAYQWANISPQIEGRRLAAKEAVEAATTVAQARAAAEVAWQ